MNANLLTLLGFIVAALAQNHRDIALALEAAMTSDPEKKNPGALTLAYNMATNMGAPWKAALFCLWALSRGYSLEIVGKKCTMYIVETGADGKTTRKSVKDMAVLFAGESLSPGALAKQCKSLVSASILCNGLKALFESAMTVASTETMGEIIKRQGNGSISEIIDEIAKGGNLEAVKKVLAYRERETTDKGKNGNGSSKKGESDKGKKSARIDLEAVKQAASEGGAGLALIEGARQVGMGFVKANDRQGLLSFRASLIGALDDCVSKLDAKESAKTTAKKKTPRKAPAKGKTPRKSRKSA